MKRLKRRSAIALIVATIGSAFPVAAIGAPPVACVPPHRLKVLDVGMVPDPVRQGQRIQLWTVKLRSDWNGECLGSLEVRDRDQVAGKRVQYLIKPGEGRYTFQAEPTYSFQSREHCFAALVNIGNTWTPIDAQRAFCARLGPLGWSLRPP